MIGPPRGDSMVVGRRRWPVEEIAFKLVVLLVVIGVLGALIYDDRRTRKIREEEDRAAAEADSRKRADAGS